MTVSLMATSAHRVRTSWSTVAKFRRRSLCGTFTLVDYRSGTGTSESKQESGCGVPKSSLWGSSSSSEKVCLKVDWNIPRHHKGCEYGEEGCQRCQLRGVGGGFST